MTTLVLSTLAENEKAIEDGLATVQETFIELGRALSNIRDQDLYGEAGYKNFDAYCLERFELSHTRAYQLMDASHIDAQLKPGVPHPKNEAQSRELARIKDDPKVMGKALKAAAAAHPKGQLTAPAIRREVAKYAPSKPAKPPADPGGDAPTSVLRRLQANQPAVAAPDVVPALMAPTDASERLVALHGELSELPMRISAVLVDVQQGAVSNPWPWEDWALVTDEAHGSIDSLPFGVAPATSAIEDKADQLQSDMDEHRAITEPVIELDPADDGESPGVVVRICSDHGPMPLRVSCEEGLPGCGFIRSTRTLAAAREAGFGHLNSRHGGLGVVVSDDADLAATGA